MKCLVTGATGFIGSELCRQLEARGITVESCGREAPTDEQLQGVDAVFHCAGIAHRSASNQDYRTHNFQASLLLAQRCAEAGVVRFIFLSSVIAVDAADDYGRWKLRTEEELLSEYRDSAMNVVVLRPALVYGPGAGGNLARLLALVQRGMPTPPPGQPRSMVGLKDLCAALCLLTEIDPGRGQVFFITDGEAYDLQRIHRCFAEATGRTVGPPRWPGWCWRLACGLYDTLRLAPFSGATYRRLFDGREYSNAALCQALGWRPSERLEDVAPGMVSEPAS